MYLGTYETRHTKRLAQYARWNKTVETPPRHLRVNKADVNVSTVYDRLTLKALKNPRKPHIGKKQIEKGLKKHG